MGLPVFKALGASFGYIATHFLTILKILWLPLALMFAVQVYFTPQALEAQVALATLEEQGADPSEVFAAMGPMFSAMGATYLAAAITYPMMIAGLLRHVVRGEAPRLPFYLSYGGDELRVLGAFVVFLIMTVLAYLAGILSVLALSVLGGFAGGAVGGLIAVVAVLALLGALIWFMVRMSLIYAAGVGTRRLGIAESWAVTEGSFWGLFFYWLIIWVVMMVVAIAFLAVAMSSMISDFMQIIAAASEGDAQTEKEAQLRMVQAQADFFDLSNPGSWLYLGGSYFMTMLVTALWVVPSGIAYRFLRGETA